MTIKKKILMAGVAMMAGAVSFTGGGVHAFTAGSVSYTQFAKDTAGQGYRLVNNERTEEARDFIENMAKRGIDFLANPDLTLEQRKGEFKDLLQSSFDIRAIGRFTMGRYWSSMSDAQRTEFQTLFESMIIESYSRRFNDYEGQGFNVTSAGPQGRADTLVRSHIVDPNGQRISVDWRVRENNGSHKVIDIIVEGVSMATTQRSEFASIIQRGGGDVQVLIDHLKS